MRTRGKKLIICLLDMLLMGYILLAVTSWNTPEDNHLLCSVVDINISDPNNTGFITRKEIINILQRKAIYPLGLSMDRINPRQIEDYLRTSPFVNTAQCYKTKNGHVNINVTQRMPVIRIMTDRGDDYFLDDQGGIMPNSQYTSDLIIATGAINKVFAQRYITPLAKAIMASEFWRNQIVQINVLPKGGVEIVPRVGQQVIFLGYLPNCQNTTVRNRRITEFANKKLKRVEKFYRYGLSQAGWNKYDYINMEFDNQIICRKADSEEAKAENQSTKQPIPEAQTKKSKETTPNNEVTEEKKELIE